MAAAHHIDKPLRLLERVAEGGAVTREEVMEADWCAPRKLDRLLRNAVLEVLQWISDADIRARDPNYGRQRLEHIKFQLREVQAMATRLGIPH